jgi:hypothetical protein
MGWRRGDKAILCQAQTEKLGKGFGLFFQHHSNGENNQIERFFYQLVLLRIDESHPQGIGERGMVYLGREAPDETNSFVLSTGRQKILEGCSCRLNVHIKKSGLYLGVLVSYGFNQVECVSTTDLRTVEVPDRLIPTSYALEEGDGLW